MKFYEIFSSLCAEKGVAKSYVLSELGISKSSCTSWKQGRNGPSNSTLKLISDYFNVPVEFLLTGKVSSFAESETVEVDDDYVTYNVLGDVAAGYGHYASEEWTGDWIGDTINIPKSYLKGRKKEDYFVLRVSGDSMYPLYMDGDKILVLKQATLNRSGQIGVVVYDSNVATLKKVEFVKGEDWMLMLPLNPNFPPIRITGAELEKCKVIGIPKMLIREIEE